MLGLYKGEKTAFSHFASYDRARNEAIILCPHRHRRALSNVTWVKTLRRNVRGQRLAITTATWDS